MEPQVRLTDKTYTLWLRLQGLHADIICHPEHTLKDHMRLFPYFFNNVGYPAQKKYHFYLLITNSKGKNNMNMVKESIQIMSLQEEGKISRFEAQKMMKAALDKHSLLIKEADVLPRAEVAGETQ